MCLVKQNILTYLPLEIMSPNNDGKPALSLFKCLPLVRLYFKTICAACTKKLSSARMLLSMDKPSLCCLKPMQQLLMSHWVTCPRRLQHVYLAHEVFTIEV